MYMLCVEDSTGHPYSLVPETFETESDALEYEKAARHAPLRQGHAVVLYECKRVRELRVAGEPDGD